MKASYVQKRKPGRPSKPTHPQTLRQEAGEKDHSSVVAISYDGSLPSLQSQALDFLKTETVYLPEEIPDDLVPALIYHRCGSTSMHNYFREKERPNLQSFVKWLTRTNQIHFDKVPSPGDVLFLHNNGLIMACRLVLSVKEEENSLAPILLPAYLHSSVERSRNGLKKKYTVTLHNWHEPVTSWYAVGKVVD